MISLGLNLNLCIYLLDLLDTRLLLHAADAVKKGPRKLCVRKNLSPCLHEEADTRLLLHAADAVKKGHRKLCVRTVDTDNVVVIAIVMFNQINPDELWLEFGTGSNFSYIPGIVLVYQFFMHSQNVNLSRLLVEEERRQLGKSGKFFLMLPKHSNTSF